MYLSHPQALPWSQVRIPREHSSALAAVRLALLFGSTNTAKQPCSPESRGSLEASQTLGNPESYAPFQQPFLTISKWTCLFPCLPDFRVDFLAEDEFSAMYRTSERSPPSFPATRLKEGEFWSGVSCPGRLPHFLAPLQLLIGEESIHLGYSSGILRNRSLKGDL